jgi:formate/nitrite transporter FocA (FNT family)
MKLPAAIYEGKTNMAGLIKNWFWSYSGNFIGSLALVAAVVASGVLAAAPAYSIKTAMAKASLPWAQVRVRGWRCVTSAGAGLRSSTTSTSPTHPPSIAVAAQAFIRAVLANWLVCVAVWNAGSASSLPGKVLGIWPPIAAFVAIGLEHSVANM